MGEKKHVFKRFRYTQCDEFARYLEEMAAKGWRFVSLWPGLTFEKAEPAEEHYDVQVFLKNKETDQIPERDTQDFAEFCEAAGWEMCDSIRRFVVFRRVREDAIPIVTESERIENAWKAQCARYLNWLPALLIWLVTVLLSLPEALFVPLCVWVIFFWVWELVSIVIRFCTLIVWKRGRERAEAEGESFLISEPAGIKAFLSVVQGAESLMAVAFCCAAVRENPSNLILIGIIMALGIFFRFLRPARIERESFSWMIAIFVVGFMLFAVFLDSAYEDRYDENTWKQMEAEGELRLADLTGEESEVVFAWNETEKTIFGSKTDYFASDEKKEELGYTIYRVRFSWLQKDVWEYVTKECEETAVAATGSWGEAEVLQVADRVPMYYVRYAGGVAVIRCDHLLSEEEIRIVREKLEM